MCWRSSNGRRNRGGTGGMVGSCTRNIGDMRMVKEESNKSTTGSKRTKVGEPTKHLG